MNVLGTELDQDWSNLLYSSAYSPAREVLYLCGVIYSGNRRFLAKYSTAVRPNLSKMLEPKIGIRIVSLQKFASLFSASSIFPVRRCETHRAVRVPRTCLKHKIRQNGHEDMEILCATVIRCAGDESVLDPLQRIISIGFSIPQQNDQSIIVCSGVFCENWKTTFLDYIILLDPPSFLLPALRLFILAFWGQLVYKLYFFDIYLTGDL